MARRTSSPPPPNRTPSPQPPMGGRVSPLPPHHIRDSPPLKLTVISPWDPSGAYPSDTFKSVDQNHSPSRYRPHSRNPKRPSSPFDSLLGVIRSAASKSIQRIEEIFYRLGFLIACYPWFVIVVSLLSASIAGVGVLYIVEEVRPEKLWISEKSDFARDSKWIDREFPNEYRPEVVLLKGDDVLTPTALAEMLKIHQTVTQIEVDGHGWEDVCARLPVVKYRTSKRKRRQIRILPAPKLDPIPQAVNLGDHFDAKSGQVTPNARGDILRNGIPLRHNLREFTVPEDRSVPRQDPTDEALETTTRATSFFGDRDIPPGILNLRPSSRPRSTVRPFRLPSRATVTSRFRPSTIDPQTTSETTTTSTTTTTPTSRTTSSDPYISTTESSSSQTVPSTSTTTVRRIKIPTERNSPQSPIDPTNYSDLGVYDYSSFELKSETLGQFWEYDFTTFDPSVVFARDDYCGMIEDAERMCMAKSLLEIWSYDEDTILSLTKEEIVEAVNNATTSPIFGSTVNYTNFLGGITYDSSGRVAAARVARMLWITHVNLSAITERDNAIIAVGYYVADNVTKSWEKRFIDTFTNYTTTDSDLEIYYEALRSFVDIASGTALQDVELLSIGYVIVFLYIILVLSNRNRVEQKVLLSILGLLAVGLSTIASTGICSALGVLYGPMHKTLPFILLGLGIDDMFVIAQCFQNLTPEEQKLSLPDRIGRTMQHAGVAITVTSVTDVAAFLVGSTTVLPALRSFCIYAAVGILAVYVYQGTFFLAFFTLDQKRIEDRRDGFLFCSKVNSKWQPPKCSERQLMTEFFRDYFSYYLLKTPVKIFVIILTTLVLSVNLWGFTQLRQEFDRIWFLPTSSYLYKYFMVEKEYYPEAGEKGAIFFGRLNYTEDLPNIVALAEKLRAQKDIIAEVDSWTDEFIPWMNKYWNASLPDEPYPESKFLDKLSLFFHSPKGSKYKYRFKFNETIDCNDEVPPIFASRIEFQHVQTHGPHEHVPAMNRVKDLVRHSGIHSGDGFSTAWARAYVNWETDEVIQHELYQSLGMAMACVFTISLLLIANMTVSVVVLICVVMTLVDVAGLMHFWGLTIDTVSSLTLILAIGLSVDYSAHVGHAFMTILGTRQERAAKTLATMGPAVFSGGFSTFLAFSLLAGTDSHVFGTFFKGIPQWFPVPSNKARADKVFFGVVVFGLYHGLCFLPVLLSLIGPAPYDSAEAKPQAHHSHHAKGQKQQGRFHKGVIGETVIDPYFVNGAINHTLVTEKQMGNHHPSGPMDVPMDSLPSPSGTVYIASGLPPPDLLKTEKKSFTMLPNGNSHWLHGDCLINGSSTLPKELNAGGDTPHTTPKRPMKIKPTVATTALHSSPKRPHVPNNNAPWRSQTLPQSSRAGSSGKPSPGAPGGGDTRRSPYIPPPDYTPPAHRRRSLSSSQQPS
ncbi:unnamed protein product [Cyprideis torosa]|uniref:Uncharacterized protein n=1 Tax=Cyprideis torosa TaxID=163714 RepID=A0A7R8ZNC5_9CRUS|nr:unnamed protein product [Cyprideis torosa]CAG0886016.1 unnamed protein product [Cyprideis torosa]